MSKIILGLFFILSAVTIQAQTFTGTGGAIPDNNTKTCFSLPVSGVGIINGAYGLTSVCLDITHPYDADLEIYLVTPDNTSIPLTRDNGGAGANYNGTCFNMLGAAGSVILGNAPFSGTYIPEGNLGTANNGQNANGTWKLCITDVATPDAGTLNSWSITFSNAPATPFPGLPPNSGNLPAGNSCSTATPICNFNGYYGNTSLDYAPGHYWPQLGDATASTGIFCGSIQNNSFVSFVASSTTASFNVWVTSTYYDFGIQMLFFGGTCNGNVTSYGCYNDILPTATGGAPTVVTATGLTVGNTYYLMFDGFSGDICDYALAPLSGVNVLTVTPSAPSICNGSGVSLTASGSTGTYSWSPSTGLSATSGATVTASPVATTTYTVSSTAIGGCPSTKDVTVTVNPLPAVSVSSVTPVCPGGNAVFTVSGTANAIVTYNINGGAAQTVTLSAAGSAIVTVSGVVSNTSINITSATLNATPVVENAITATGGTNPGNATGAISAAGTIPSTGNSAQVSSGSATLTLTLAHTVPAGTTIIISISRNSTGGAVTITDGTANQTFTAGPNDVLQRINFVTGVATNTITINRTGGTVWIDGVQYSYVPGCTIAFSLSNTVTVGLSAAPTVTTPVTYCQGNPATALTATGTNLLWYTVPTGGVGSSTAPTPLTTATGSTIYYVSQTPGSCESPRAAITVTINATPAAPAVTTPVTYCEGAVASILTATGTNLLWYTTAAGGVGFATSPVPSTATPGSTIYYVSQTQGSCESPRAAITVTVNATPAAPTVTTPVTYCQGEVSSALTATGANLLWYTGPFGGVGSATAPTPSTAATGSTVYYVSQTINTCESPRAAIAVTVNQTPVAPTVITPVEYCKGAIAAALTATGTNLLWYTTASGGTGSATAPTPSTTTVGSTIYYVSQTSGICEGPRAAITVTINPIPALPTVTTPVIYCQGVAAATLTATGANLLWYSTAFGGASSATAPTPSTLTTGSTIFYVSQTISSCEGPRAAITVTINPTPAAPTVTSPVIYCQGVAAVALNATGTNLLWYTTAVGGVGSATAPTPSTAVTGSTIYYVSQTTGICEGPRAAITVTINPTPAAPTVSTPVTYCEGDAATALTGTGTNLLWYTVPVGGVGSATAPIPSTAVPGSTIYYVSQTTGVCEGPRAAITVTINPTPAAPSVTSPVVYCRGEAAVALTATGTNLLWYTTAVGGAGSATAPTPSTAATGSTIYYVSQTTGICEGPRASITVTINPTPAAPTVTTPVTYCEGDAATALTATGANLLWYTTAVGGAGSATAPTPSTAAAGSTIYYVSQTTGICEGPRAAITVTINAMPAAPIVTSPVTYCQGTASSALTATGANLLWYTTAVGGAGSATAPTPSTAVTGSTIYYVSQATGTCEGPRAAITVTIYPTPAAPSVTSPVVYCQGEAAIALTATGTNLLWYTTPAGGAGSATAPIPSTAFTGSTIYYVSQTTGVCEGPRASITVTINPTPAAPTVTTPVTYCEGVTAAALTATGTNLLWYTTAVGGVGSATAPTPSTAVTGSTVYYVSQTTGICEGPRAAITVTINTMPAAPTVTTPVTYCEGAVTTALTATGTNLLWYTTAVGGVGSATAPTPSTATTGNTIYYVSQATGTCEGPRAAITVTIDPTPTAPTVTTPVTYCEGVPATALTATGTNLLWYTTAAGGVGSATAPTPSTAVTGSTIYYVSQTTGTCEGPRVSITVTINPTPAAPTVTTPVTYCEGAVTTALTATGTNLLWYTVPVGGVGSATAPTPIAAAAGSTIYYVSQTTGICEGPRASITVTINPTPTAPTVTTPVTYCQGAASSALTATGTNLLWYTTAVGGAGSATAPTPSTAATGSTIYYVSQATGTCEGPREAITVTINPTPTAPTVITPVTYCEGTAATALTATGTNLLWYTVPVGGVGSATAPTPSTVAPGSTIYYVSQTTGICEGPRASISVTVNPTPTAPTVTTPVTYCQGAVSSTLTATGTNLLWYTVPVGGVGSATAPTPSTATTGSVIYYVSQTTGVCEGPRTAITVTINATPAAPAVTTPVTYCQGAVLSVLTATGTNLLWYTVPVGGVGSATAPTPSTATTGSTIYYVSQTTGICEGPRASITVTINPTPAAPSVTSSVVYCEGGTATALTATGTNLLWYTTAVGGVGSATAPTPSTATTGSTTYYVSQTTGACEGPRAAITVTINAAPAAPTVTSPVTYCQGAAAVALTATGTNLLWYTTAVGGAGSATAPTPSTAATGSTIYYVSQTTGICEGPRAAITVTVNATPVAPTVTSPVAYCEGATATALTATGTNLLWYTTASGGVGSATAPIPSTATAGSTIYYVSQTTGTCEGPRAAIIVTINALPAAPTVTSPVIYCRGEVSVALTATGTNLLWYSLPAGGAGSATAPTPSTATTGSTIYYVSQTTGTCEGPRAAITVTVNATPAPPTVTSPVTYCEGAAATALTATGTNLLWYTTAVGGAGSATAPTPSTIATGSAIYYVSQTTGTCEGPRASITVTINPTPAAPTVTTPVTYCEGATATALTATGTNLLWYTTAVGGAGSATAPIPSTIAAGSTNYYVSQTNGTCEGPRAAITVTINPTPAAPSVTTPVTYCEGAAATTLTATGTNLLWYTVPVGGAGSATAPTPSTATTGSTIYYVSQTTGTCEGPRAAITVTVNATPAAPTVTSPVTYCQGAVASALTAAGTNLLWYTAAVGGAGSATAPIPSTAATGSVIYYVSQTNGTCEGPRAAITVTINTLPAAPTVTTPVTYCQGDASSVLTATGTNLLWYTTAAGGVGSATAPTPSTAVTGSVIYYVSQTNGICEGPRAAITVTINALPAAPTVTTPITYCQGTASSALTATGTNLLWYTTAVGGVGSATAPTPSTAATGSTIYYVSQATGTCEGPRAAITVTINALPAAPTVTSPVTYCQGTASSVLTATGTNLLWYTTAVGGAGSATAPTPSTAVTGSTIYYVSQATGTCEGPRASITVTINPTPAAPTVTTPVTYCEGAAATALTATGANLLWYTVAVGGVGSATAPTPSTVTPGSTIYYVSQTTGICEGPRASITVTINATPTAPTVTSPVAYCQGAASSALTATGTNLLWYTTASGGVGSATAPMPSTATTGSTIYYVSQTTGVCEGPRASITVTVNPTPAAPSITSPVVYCQGTTATPLTATGTNLLWYTTATGGTGSATAPIPSTTAAGSTNYYVSQTAATCEGPRASITVTVNTLPAAPTVTSPVAYCRGATSSTLTATGTNLLWYIVPVGGLGSVTAPTPSTAVAGSTVYYVSQTTGTCEGPRASITVTVNPASSVYIGIDTTICQGDSVHFIPIVTPAANSYAWRSITPNVPNSTISSINTIETTVNPVNTAQYVLRAVYAGCPAEDTVQVNVRWKPIVDAGPNTAICSLDSALLSGVVSHFAGLSTDISYTWTPTDSLTTPTAIQTWAHPAYSTLYTFTAITTKALYGCDFSVSDSMKLTVQPPVHAFAGNDTIAMSGVPHQLYGSGGVTYYWSSPTAIINDPNRQNPTAILTGDANFFLKVQDAIGCTGYDSVFVKLYNGPTFYVPTAFSPNGDGLNDILRPTPAGISTISFFRVFNRYGELLFETNQYLKGWDGTFKGKPQPVGTYVWMAGGVDRYNHIVNMKGTVILIR